MQEKKFYLMTLVLAFYGCILFTSVGFTSDTTNLEFVSQRPSSDCFFGKPDLPCKEGIWLANIVYRGQNFSITLLPLEVDTKSTLNLVGAINDPKLILKDLSDLISPWILHDFSMIAVTGFEFSWKKNYEFSSRAVWTMSGATPALEELTTAEAHVLSQFGETNYLAWIKWTPKSLSEKEFIQIQAEQFKKFSNCSKLKKESTNDCKNQALLAYGDYLKKLNLKNDSEAVVELLNRALAAWLKNNPQVKKMQF